MHIIYSIYLYIYTIPSNYLQTKNTNAYHTYLQPSIVRFQSLSTGRLKWSLDPPGCWNNVHTIAAQHCPMTRKIKVVCNTFEEMGQSFFQHKSFPQKLGENKKTKPSQILKDSDYFSTKTNPWQFFLSFWNGENVTFDLRFCVKGHSLNHLGYTESSPESFSSLKIMPLQ